MIQFIAVRLAAFVPTLLAISAVLFLAINVIPGGAAQASLGIKATPQAIARFNREHGLDRPLPEQYVAWLGKVLQGDFGKSLQSGTPVGPELLVRLALTLELAILAFLIANLIAVPLGCLAAYHHQRPADNAIILLATIMGALPNFWLATLLILFFTVTLHWLPPGGYVPFGEAPLENLSLMLMPAISLGVVSSALLLRIMRTGMIEVISSDYIRTARAKGAGQSVVIWRHALRNALIPYLTVGGVEFSLLFGGVVIVENIFLLPGVGQLALIGISQRDYPLLLASVLLIAVVVLSANLIVDVVGAWLDPRRVRTVRSA
jgi:peptide/nickel transport system permease protein